jgi:hypothetical protein
MLPCSGRNERDILYYLAGLRNLARAVLAVFFVNGTESSQDTNLIMRTAMRDN